MTLTTSRRTPFIAAALLLAAFTGGCSVTDEGAAKLIVAPGGYDLYSCPQLVRTAESLRARRRELENLMAKADTDAAGRFMGTLGYRADYVSVRGQMHELEVAARQKQCDISPPPPPRAPRAARPAPRPSPR